MYTPVNQRTTACYFFRCKRTAKSRNRTKCTKTQINMIYLAQTSVLNILPNQVYHIVKPVHDADIQGHSRFMLYLLHFQRFRIGSCCRLFTEYMLARTHRVDRNNCMHPIGRTNRDCFHFRIFQYPMIILHCNAAAIFFYCCLCALRNNIAEIFDLYVLIF